jgi:hypothetical protein
MALTEVKRISGNLQVNDVNVYVNFELSNTTTPNTISYYFTYNNINVSGMYPTSYSVNDGMIDNEILQDIFDVLEEVKNDYTKFIE